MSVSIFIISVLAEVENCHFRFVGNILPNVNLVCEEYNVKNAMYPKVVFLQKKSNLCMSGDLTNLPFFRFLKTSDICSCAHPKPSGKFGRLQGEGEITENHLSFLHKCAFSIMQVEEYMACHMHLYNLCKYGVRY